MAISDFFLVDVSNGTIMGADSTVIVPEVFGEHADSIDNDVEAAIEYGSDQGVPLEEPGAGALEVLELEEEERSYLAIDLDNGYLANVEDILLLPYAEETAELPAEELSELAQDNGQVPTVSRAVLDAEGLPYSPIFEDDEED